MAKYDYLVVGAGIFGCVFAHRAVLANKKVLVIDKRAHKGGNIYCKSIEGINVHMYGAHIFHTNNERVWQFITQFADFNDFINMPIANYKGELYNLPFNMNTFKQMWNVQTPQQAQAIINEQIAKEGITNPRNLEEKALATVGRDIYEKLIKGYTQKQWGKKATELPPFIIGRLPIRFTFNNNYFNDKYQGIPKGGYNGIADKLLKGARVELNCDFFANKELLSLAKNVIFCGAIDEFYDNCYGALEYRSLNFEHKVLNKKQYQPTAVVNYTDNRVRFTRIIEHKQFEGTESDITVITKEYPASFSEGMERYYPINNEANTVLYKRYAKLAQEQKKIRFAGRLGDYSYYNMDDTILRALELADELLMP